MENYTDLGYKALYLAILNKIEESERVRSMMKQLRDGEKFLPKTSDTVKDLRALSI